MIVKSHLNMYLLMGLNLTRVNRKEEEMVNLCIGDLKRAWVAIWFYFRAVAYVI